MQYSMHDVVTHHGHASPWLPDPDLSKGRRSCTAPWDTIAADPMTSIPAVLPVPADRPDAGHGSLPAGVSVRTPICLHRFINICRHRFIKLSSNLHRFFTDGNDNGWALLSHKGYASLPAMGGKSDRFRCVLPGEMQCRSSVLFCKGFLPR